MKSLILTIIASLIIMIVGCVGGGNPINTGITKDVKIIDLDNLPVIAYDSVSAIGMLGAYSLTLSPDGDFELNSMRTSALGESYVVSGRHFFTGYCRDCLRVNSVSLDDNENIVLNFAVKHPFEKGNPAELPSATNRLDLDVFDLALVIEPLDLTPITYTQINVDVYTDILYNADGYTLDLTGVVGKEIALPYKICYQNSENNRFVMGTNFQSFDVIFNNRSIFTFNLYLTMGYGVSADFWGRTYPVYFVPEFNRKAAWKINVTSLSPDETWEEMDKNTKRDITINIYDWNHGTVVANTYPDINNTDHISALSDIISVTVEVPGMTNELITAETDDTETNGWDDPLTYTASFANENGISKGFYTGLVKVTDSRIPGESVIGTEPDILIDVPDGNRIGYDIPEFATYQTFSVLIKGEHTGWTRTWGGLGDDAGTDVIVDELGNTYVTGYFSSLVDFDPGPDEEKRACLGMAHDVFLSKFDSKGVFLWVQTWGGPGGDMVYSAILSTSSDNIYITGHFAGTVDFDPGPGEDWYTSNGIIDVFLLKLDSNGDYQWAKTWGNSSIGTDEGRGVTIDNSNNVYITGDFYGTVDFDPGPDVVQYTASSSGKSDIFLSSFDSDGNFRWARVWGDDKADHGMSVSTDRSEEIYVTGSFTSYSVDFDPGPGEDIRTGWVFISKFDTNGNFIWARTWGNNSSSVGENITYYDETLYVVGMFSGTNDFDPSSNVLLLTSIGSTDSYLSKFDTNGNFIWALSWGGELADYVYRVAVDDLSNIYVTGLFRSNTVDFDPGPGIIERVNNSDYDMSDMFLTKLDSNGDFKWVRVWGDDDDDYSNSVTVDNSNNVYVTGGFKKTVDFDPGPDADEHTSVWKKDAYVIKLLENGHYY